MSSSPGHDPQHGGAARHRHDRRGRLDPGGLPGAVRDPDTGAWISDAEVAETTYTAFPGRPEQITARLVVRRVKDANHLDALFPVWRYHPFLTNSTLSTVEADITTAATPSSRPCSPTSSTAPGAHALRALLAPTPPDSVRSHRPQPLRAAEYSPAAGMPKPAEPPYGERSSTSPPACPARNADPSCDFPPTGPGQTPGATCGTTQLDTAHRHQQQPDQPPHGPTKEQQEKLGRPAATPAHHRKPVAANSPHRTPSPSVDRG